MLFGESGIITKAQKAAKETNDSVNKDLTDISDLEEKMEEALGKVPQTTKGKLVDKNIKYAKYTDSTSKVSVPIPGGYGVVQDSTTDTDNDRKVNTIANGLVISDVEEDDLDNTKKGNQFVWVPVSEEQLQEMYGTDSKGKSHGKLYDFTSTGKTKSNWNETNGVMSITSSISSREPDILNDDIDGDTVIGYSEKGIEQLKNVIGIIPDKNTENANKNILDKWQVELEDKFNNMIESVKKYKGFYIGRYETGNLSGTDNTVKAVVQKGNSDIKDVNWYYQYRKIKNIAQDNNNVETSMIWGCQWDRTLEWIVETNSTDKKNLDYTIVKNSKSWGNYVDTVGTLASINRGKFNPSGTNKEWQKNHIYDLAGNVREWTMEASDTSSHSYRGGSYKDSNSSVSYRGTLQVFYSDYLTRFPFNTLYNQVVLKNTENLAIKNLQY